MKPLIFAVLVLTLTGCEHRCRSIVVITKQSNAPALAAHIYGGSRACYTASNLTDAFRKCVQKEKICSLEYVR